LIAEENIITSDGRKLVKIPLRYLDQYRFRYGQLGSGAGQGQGHVGDVIARDSEHGKRSEQPGDSVMEHTAPRAEHDCPSALYDGRHQAEG
jgi:uncharacterized sporulation protein YeaH/YhbH (DUF444 family)